MSYPTHSSLAFRYLGFNPDSDFSCYTDDGVNVTVEWSSASPQPTEQQIADTLADPAFIAWQEENGGDPVKTGRRRKRELLDSDMGKVLLAVVEGLVNEINTLRAEHSLPPRTEQQVRDYVVNAINNGERD